MENRANGQFQTKLDGNLYEKSELVTIKVPARNLAYYNNSKQFERIDGQIEIGGLQYNFVERRLYNDSIEMRCIPNFMATHLKNAKNDFFKLVNDLQSPCRDKKTDMHSLKNFSGDYCTVNDPFRMDDLLRSVKKSSFCYIETPASNFSFTEEHPPQKTA